LAICLRSPFAILGWRYFSGGGWDIEFVWEQKYPLPLFVIVMYVCQMIIGIPQQISRSSRFLPFQPDGANSRTLILAVRSSTLNGLVMTGLAPSLIAYSTVPSPELMSITVEFVK